MVIIRFDDLIGIVLAPDLSDGVMALVLLVCIGESTSVSG